MPAAHRIEKELRAEMTAQEFDKYAKILMYGRGVENMQFHLAWRYGQEGKTFDEFMDSFTEAVPYVKWGDRI
jgi:hypothetical protein